MGNQSEHKGLYYNLEARNRSVLGSYSNRVSLSMALTSTQLSTVNSAINNNNAWANLNNCSHFAMKVWNSVASTKVSNGTIGTPTALRDNIMTKAGHKTGVALPYDYKVYYQKGTTSPTRSTVY